MSVTLPPEIIDLEDYTESINAVLYADSGTGKTVFGGSDDRVLFLALRQEKGTISAKRMGSKGKVWKIQEWDDLDKAFQWLEENPGLFDWIVIDSVTAMQVMCMRSILDIQFAGNSAKFDQDLPTQQNWQEYYNLFDRFIMYFNDLHYNVLYLATTMQNEDPEGEPIVMPNLYGRQKGYSVSQALCASVGVVGRLSKSIYKKGTDDESEVREIAFSAVPPYFAKDRYHVLPKRFVVSRNDEQVNSLKDLRILIENSSSSPKNKPAPKKAAPPTRRVVPKRPARPAAKK